MLSAKKNRSTHFWELWSEHKEGIKKCCFRWLYGDEDSVNDVLSYTAEKAYLNYINNEDKIEKPFPWLCRIAHNLCMDIHRETSKQQSIVEKVSELPNQFFFSEQSSRSLEDIVTNQSLIEALRQRIQNLPPELKQAIEFRFYRGMEYDEMAELLCTSQANVRKRVQLGRQRLSAMKQEYLC